MDSLGAIRTTSSGNEGFSEGLHVDMDVRVAASPARSGLPPASDRLPWQMFVPERRYTRADVRKQEAHVKDLSARGDHHATGLGYLKLAHMYKHFGPLDGRSPFATSADAASLALQHLRQTTDVLSLAQALRASVVAFQTDHHPEAKERLEESLKISEQVGDAASIGWSHHALATHALRTGDPANRAKHQRLAIQAFKAADDPELRADGLFQEALHETRRGYRSPAV